MSDPEQSQWLVRIPEIFDGVAAEVLDGIGASSKKRLGSDYYLIQTATPEAVRGSEFGKFIRWSLPVGHAWPCNPRKMDGFIEKAAQAMVQKFAERAPQGLFAGQLNPAGRRISISKSSRRICAGVLCNSSRD